MASVGYTPGQRNSPQVSWGKNLGKSTNIDQHTYKMSCYFAHVWGEALEILPPVVVDDYVEAAKKLDGLHMDDGKLRAEGTVLRYSLKLNGVELPYKTSAPAPASGQCSSNYCKYVILKTFIETLKLTCQDTLTTITI